MGNYFPAFQVISVIRPPGRPAEAADRRIWWMKSIVRRLAFVYFLSFNLSQHKPVYILSYETSSSTVMRVCEWRSVSAASSSEYPTARIVKKNIHISILFATPAIQQSRFCSPTCQEPYALLFSLPLLNFYWNISPYSCNNKFI